jgi:hypothetical protein
MRPCIEERVGAEPDTLLRGVGDGESEEAIGQEEGETDGPRQAGVDGREAEGDG